MSNLEAEVVRMRFTERKSLDETAQKLGVSRLEVRRIESEYARRNR